MFSKKRPSHLRGTCLSLSPQVCPQASVPETLPSAPRAHGGERVRGAFGCLPAGGHRRLGPGSRPGIPDGGSTPASPPGALLCSFLCPCAHVLVFDLVICLSALRRDPLVCASLSSPAVDGAWGPASNQLKTFSLGTLGPRGSCPGCCSYHGVPEDRGHVHDPGPGHDGG